MSGSSIDDPACYRHTGIPINPFLINLQYILTNSLEEHKLTEQPSRFHLSIIFIAIYNASCFFPRFS